MSRILTLVATVAAFSVAVAQAQGGATLQDAQTKLQSQDFAGAAAILDQVTQAQPENVRAWMLQGFALSQLGRNEEALISYHRALELPQTPPRAYYNVALVHAAMGHTDSAFAWLSRARETGAVDLTGMDRDPRTASLREDPRYHELFPSKEEFARPFAEDARIIREWVGEAAGDQFGWIARNIGDVDGDGIDDVTTSAPSKNLGGARAGRIYVYSSGSGELLWSASGSPGDWLGSGIEAAGDVNADGIPDVIAGAPGAGKAYVYHGGNGTVLLTLAEEGQGDNFGRKVSDLGDVNGDGHDDVIVGAPLNDAAGEDAGAAYIFSGKDGSLLHTIRGEQPGDNFGSSAGGWTGPDGMLIVIGAPNAGPQNGGRAYVYDDLSGEPSFIIESDEGGSQLGGMFVSVVGDVNADGTPDVYASDWAHGAKGPFTGRIYVHSGNDGSRLYTMTGEAPGDGYGIGVADVGDVDHDGADDLLVGAWQHASGAPSGGKAYLYSGRDGSLTRVYTGIVPGETFGFDTTGVGDVDGDGTVDFLVTSARSAIKGSWAGRMFIISGR